MMDVHRDEKEEVQDRMKREREREGGTRVEADGERWRK